MNACRRLFRFLRVLRNRSSAGFPTQRSWDSIPSIAELARMQIRSGIELASVPIRTIARTQAEFDPEWQATLRDTETGGLIYLKKDGRMIPERYLNQWALSELNPPFVPDIERVRVHVQNNRLRVESGSLETYQHPVAGK